MTQLTKRRKTGSILPMLRDDIFTNRFLTPGLFDFDDFWGETIADVPLANIKETDKDFKVELCVPGFKKEDFKIDIEDRTLTISSEREEKKEDDKEYRRREFSYSSFSRTLQLPQNVDENKINAKYDNGMLELTLPKKEVSISKPSKNITVQ
jgi:HSP20 family protein